MIEWRLNTNPPGKLRVGKDLAVEEWKKPLSRGRSTRKSSHRQASNRLRAISQPLPYWQNERDFRQLAYKNSSPRRSLTWAPSLGISVLRILRRKAKDRTEHNPMIWVKASQESICFGGLSVLAVSDAWVGIANDSPLLFVFDFSLNTVPYS